MDLNAEVTCVQNLLTIKTNLKKKHLPLHPSLAAAIKVNSTNIARKLEVVPPSTEGTGPGCGIGEVAGFKV